ncbi:Ig-like domain-containing protein [Colwellia sp. TT2012]|uniref:Ig-like domain-containing protein n=1 Tax=Colwellia sp. TT2012 TaxID=1720342 RepID=UPI00070FD2D9|nr:Ig-like domain-containing protein [Colwellia sp. TT2012]
MQLFRRLSFTMLLMSLMTLVACGDGDGNLLGDGDDAVTLTVTKSDGDLSAANDITITATVLANGSPVANKTVTFTFAVEGSATFDPITGTATTDADGTAEIKINVTDYEGSVKVIASYESATDNISFESAGNGVKIVIGEPQPATITLFASSQQLPSSGVEMITLTAIAKDVNNHLLVGVTINFNVDSGTIGGVENAEGDISNVTDINGRVQKGLITPANPENRVITVNVSSSDGDVTDSLEIEVVGTTITLTGTSSLALNDESSYIVNVLDSDGNGVANSTVAVSLLGLSTDAPAGKVADITIPATVTTDAEGQVTVKVTGISGGTNTLLVSSLSASASQDVSVQADSFLFTSFSNGVVSVDPATTPVVPDVSLIQTASLTLTWRRNAVPVVGKEVTFTTTRGVLLANDGVTIITKSITDNNGQVTVNLTSNNAGKALVTFVGSDTVDDKAIELTNQLEFEFFADIAAKIKAQASPNSIGPNEQNSTISVVVKDVNGNLVKNKRVKFILTDISGGSIFPATAVTDSSGNASTIYTSNSTSAKDAVSIEAIVEDTAITDTVTLTVSKRELFITLGTGNTLEELGVTDYIKEYSVFVTDVDSNPVANVDLAISLIPDRYYKGHWARLYDGDKFKVWVTNAVSGDIQVRTAPISCDNEDINLNGILDFGEDLEDTNNDGVLTPGNVAIADGTVTTDENGRAIVQITYGQSYGHWVNIHLIASAKVTGSESLNQTIFTLPVLASDIASEELSPPRQGVGSEGPFGGNQSCSVPD